MGKNAPSQNSVCRSCQRLFCRNSLRHLIRPGLKVLKSVGTERRCDGYIRCVTPLGQQDSADARNIVTRVERMPMTAKISFEPCCEITGWMRLWRAHIAEISGAIARRDVQVSLPSECGGLITKPICRSTISTFQLDCNLLTH